MTVAELISFLQTQPQHLPVAYSLFSEFKLMREHEIVVGDLCEPREDDWVADKRPDKPSRRYLIFPGN